MSKSTAMFAVVLLAFWSALIGVADYFVIGTIVRQYRATQFRTTQCEITQSQVAGHTLFRSGVSLAYSYTVNKEEYRGTRYRYDDEYSSSPGGETIRRLPIWTKHQVYYNPDHPADAVLAVGVNGGDLMMILFAIPANVALLTLWRWIMGRLGEDWRVPRAGGVRIRRQNGSIRVRVGGVGAGTAALWGLGGSAFAAAFPVVMFAGTEPGLAEMEYVLGTVAVVGLVACFWAALRNASGKYDLVIDEKTRSVTLPQTCGRTTLISVEKDALAGVCVQRRVSRLTSGSYYSYLPALQCADPIGSRYEALSPWGWTEQRARAFSEWLGQQIGLEFKGVQEEPAA